MTHASREPVNAQRLRTPESDPEHRGARHRRSGARATLAVEALTKDERAVLRAWRTAQRDTGGVLTPQVIQRALRRKVRRVREQMSGFQRQRDIPRTVGNIQRSLDSIAESFASGNEDTQTLQSIIEIEQQAVALRQTALTALHSEYSDADLAEALGRSRQSVWEMRTGSRKGRAR